MAVTRQEKLLNSVANGVPSDITPITREEQYLSYIGGGSSSYPTEPITRKEVLLKQIAENGVSGGGGVTIKNQNKTITENGTYKADSGYTGLGTVVVDVATSGGGGDDSALIALIERTGTEFTVPNSVTKIGDAAFSNHKTLETLHIPDSVTSMGGSVFTNCKALKNVRLSENTTSIGMSCFYGCSALPSITIPSSVTQILSYAFMGCTALRSVTIKGKLSFGTDVFDDCNYLTDIYVPWAEGAVEGAPWGATNATIHYNSEV